MSVGLVEKSKRQDPQVPMPISEGKSNSGVRDALRGKSYDEQVQMTTPKDGRQQPPLDQAAPAEQMAAEVGAAIPAPEEMAADAASPEMASASADEQAAGAPAPKATEGPEQSEAQQLRDAVSKQAKAKDGQLVLGKEKTEKIRNGYTDEKGVRHEPMANFTTCIEFARSTISDASADLYKGDTKTAQATSAAVSDAKVAWETAQSERVKARRFEGFTKRHEEQVLVFANKAKDARDKAAKMRERVEGESDVRYKQRSAQAAGLEAVAKQYDSVVKTQQGLVDRFQKMVDQAHGKAEQMDASNKAMIKAKRPLSGRPQEGEYIILEQGQDDMYGKPGSEKLLAAGSFKHIAVFMGLVGEDTEYETWKVTEGGGELASTNEIRVKKDDLMIISRYTSESDLGTSKGSRLAGWIDAGELIKMRNQKLGKKG